MKKISPILLLVVPSILVSGCATSPSSDRAGTSTCEQHAAVATVLNQWGARQFDRLYGKDQDSKNAVVQLFIIEQKAPTDYARSFNQNENKYAANYKQAEKKRCDVASYPLSPIEEFKAGMNRLDAKSAK